MEIIISILFALIFYAIMTIVRTKHKHIIKDKDLDKIIEKYKGKKDE